MPDVFLVRGINEDRFEFKKTFIFIEKKKASAVNISFPENKTTLMAAESI